MALEGILIITQCNNAKSLYGVPWPLQVHYLIKLELLVSMLGEVEGRDAD